MDVRLLIDLDETFLLEGSVIQDVREEDDNYVGLFCSCAGSYEVKVPKENCEVWDEEKENRKFDEALRKVIRAQGHFKGSV